ncbi:MAG: GerMN domain-containing protein [Faecousia sp.]
MIHSEERDLTGHRDDLRYMVGLYLAGPLEEGLSIPFTKTTRLLSAEKTDGIITIELSDHTYTMTDSEFSLACACLTLTCMSFTECESVTVISGPRSVTMDKNNILLYDSLPQQETTGG